MKPDDETTAAELAKQQAEPFVKAEWYLVLGSLLIGLISLAVLFWLTRG